MKQLFHLCILSCVAVFLSVNVFAQKTVGLDNWFNRETHKKTGKIYHYTWDDEHFSGFSRFGEVFKSKGAQIKTIASGPEMEILKDLDIYIIVDPDTPSESVNPNYILKKDRRIISKWVKNGGVLLLMANDGPNCEFTHLNRLAGSLGFNFNPVTLNPVVNRQWDMGAEACLTDHPVFKGVHKIFLKEVSSISLRSKKAKAVLTDGNDILMAETKFGKGFVFAVGDPWLYNEYIDHALLPSDFENLKVANNLCEYLLGKIGK